MWRLVAGRETEAGELFKQFQGAPARPGTQRHRVLDGLLYGDRRRWWRRDGGNGADPNIDEAQTHIFGEGCRLPPSAAVVQKFQSAREWDARAQCAAAGALEEDYAGFVCVALNNALFLENQDGSLGVALLRHLRSRQRHGDTNRAQTQSHSDDYFHHDHDRGADHACTLGDDDRNGDALTPLFAAAVSNYTFDLCFVSSANGGEMRLVPI